MEAAAEHQQQGAPPPATGAADVSAAPAHPPQQQQQQPLAHHARAMQASASPPAAPTAAPPPPTTARVKGAQGGRRGRRAAAAAPDPEPLVRLGQEVLRSSERLRSGWHPVKLSAEDKAAELELDERQLAAGATGGYKMVRRTHAWAGLGVCLEWGGYSCVKAEWGGSLARFRQATRVAGLRR